MHEPNRSLDLRGLTCPLPVLKARKALSAMPVGARLEVLTDDPKAPADLAELCAAQGHRLVSSEATAAGHRTVIERGAGR
ncbi:MAG: sulfurtransferase TusA family protein [Geminicoccaceae bacterium]|nr:sulfurtransferase TusA family protein [Geminicoccaceae bacterium]MCX7630790.1 sulfurtransferase TusA family protein [Geminicoccaceae bacterium]MDW8125135.1 sulfurtransferase TusA family protein [Geminicoccaceae bacterium]